LPTNFICNLSTWGNCICINVHGLCEYAGRQL
jgi:hypothetical protein